MVDMPAEMSLYASAGSAFPNAAYRCIIKNGSAATMCLGFRYMERQGLGLAWAPSMEPGWGHLGDRRTGAAGFAGMCLWCQLKEAIMALWHRLPGGDVHGPAQPGDGVKSDGLRCVGVVPALLLWGHELIDAARPPPPPMSCGGIAVRAPSSTATLARMPRLVVSSATFAGVARQAFRLPRDVAAYSRHGLQWASSRVHMVELRTHLDVCKCYQMKARLSIALCVANSGRPLRSRPHVFASLLQSRQDTVACEDAKP
ncbi:hypothetical protein PSPO01_13278 [Paraphaeosphaeria sporulosa]